MWAGTRRLLLLDLAVAGEVRPGPADQRGEARAEPQPARQRRRPARRLRRRAPIDQLMRRRGGGPAWDEAGFAALRDQVRADLVDMTLEVVGHVQRILAAAYEVEQRLARDRQPGAAARARPTCASSWPAGAPRVRHRDRLRPAARPACATCTAIERRLDKLPTDPQRDRERMDRARGAAGVRPAGRRSPTRPARSCGRSAG